MLKRGKLVFVTNGAIVAQEIEVPDSLVSLIQGLEAIAKVQREAVGFATGPSAKIEGLKFIRGSLGLGLKDAKDLYEELVQQFPRGF